MIITTERHNGKLDTFELEKEMIERVTLRNGIPLIIFRPDLNYGSKLVSLDEKTDLAPEDVYELLQPYLITTQQNIDQHKFRALMAKHKN